MKISDLVLIGGGLAAVYLISSHKTTSPSPSYTGFNSPWVQFGQATMYYDMLKQYGIAAPAPNAPTMSNSTVIPFINPSGSTSLVGTIEQTVVNAFNSILTITSGGVL